MLFYNAGGNWYSARLYRSLNHDGVMSAVFCICLCDGIYIKVKLLLSCVLVSKPTLSCAAL